MKPLTLTLTAALPLTVAIGVATATTAGAGVRWGIDTPTIDTRCDGRNAITQLETNLDGRPLHTGDTIQATWQTRPGCEATNIRVAAHATGSLTFDETETQPLIEASGAVLAATGRLVYTIPQGVEPGCQVQVDLITGDPLPAVSPSARYNEFAIGGSRSRLIAAGYAAGECETLNPPTTTQVPTTIVQRETPLPPSTVTTATPPTSWPQVDETVPQVSPPPEPAAPSTTITELLTQRLPETGRGMGAAKLGGVLLAVGVAAYVAALTWLRRTKKEWQS